MYRFFLLLPLSLLFIFSGAAWAQLPYSVERPGGLFSDPLEQPRDVTGRSVKMPRIRMLRDPKLAGSAGWMLNNDPWLAYAWGRELALREFSTAEGAFGESGRLSGTTLEDQATPMTVRSHVNSCAACHNTPWRDMGAGINISKNSSAGRNTPHLFGAGVVEMVGAEIRHQLLQRVDENGDGWVSASESRGPARVEPVKGRALDFGRFDDRDGDHRPDLNPVVYVWYVDEQGRRIPWARGLSDPGVAGYNFSVQVFGHGQNDRVGHGGLGATLREVSASAWDMHSGLQAYDPTCNQEGAAGLTTVSPAGAQQFFTGFSRDLGQVLEGGVSRDDPDRDGVVHEISEGDLDLIEWYLLNHPTPEEKLSSSFYLGREIADKSGCFECHTPNWRLPQDRRFFEFRGQELRRLSGGPTTVKGIYSDFRQHDLGPDFHEVQFDGSRRTHFRTPPLWGVGTSAPYGHDGASLTLEDVIERHGGEASESAARYRRLSESERLQLIAFLRGLVLRSTDRPLDLDGDGQISQHFVVAGMDTGVERFNPEWLFGQPGKIGGAGTGPNGEPVLSWALSNLKEAYGLMLPALRDQDHDGFPDL